MLVFNSHKNEYEIDPHFLSIIPFQKVLKQECGYQKLLWIYHMFNPHSQFKNYQNNKKSNAIVQAYFPKAFLDKKEKALQSLIDEAILKNKEIDLLADTVVEDGELKPKKQSHVFVPKLKLYDPEEDDGMEEAIDWYKNHLKETPLWFAYESYKEAIYNLGTIVRKSTATAGEISTASKELDTLPRKMEQMRQQAEKDEAMTIKVSGEKNIKRSEKVFRHQQNQDKQMNLPIG